MKKGLTLCLLLVFMAVASNGVCATTDNLVVNGDFEVFEDLKPGPNSWTVYTKIPGWESTVGHGIEIQPSGTVTKSQSGRYHVELDSHSNSNMTQSLLLGAGSYELSFWYKPRTGTENDNNIDFSLADFSLADVFADSIFDVRGQGTDWKQVIKKFNIDSADYYALTFAAGGIDNSLGGVIDNVRMVRVPAPVATPVPTSLVLLFSGVAGFAALKRKNVMN